MVLVLATMATAIAERPCRFPSITLTCGGFAEKKIVLAVSSDVTHTEDSDYSEILYVLLPEQK